MQADVGLASHIPVMDLHLTDAQAELLGIKVAISNQ